MLFDDDYQLLALHRIECIRNSN